MDFKLNRRLIKQNPLDIEIQNYYLYHTSLRECVFGRFSFGDMPFELEGVAEKMTDGPLGKAIITRDTSWPTFQKIKIQIEAILFAAEDALEVGEIRAYIGDASLSEVRMALRDLAKEYDTRAFELVELGNKWQLRTRAEYSELMKMQYTSKPRSLSKSALETLAIIAYQQPVTRAQINAIRGVDGSSIVGTLKDKDLVYVSGRRSEVGNPLEYRTTQKFLEVFGLGSLKDLPSLRSLQMGFEEQKQVELALNTLRGNIEEPVTPGELSFPDNSVPESYSTSTE